MRKKLSCLLPGLLAVMIVFGQSKLNFRSINMVGLAAGKSGGYSVLQTINGLGNDKWFTGAGVGIDSYAATSVPLFLDARRSFAATSFFVFGDLGYNFPRHNKPGKEVTYYATYRFSGGVYSELGIGYKLQLARKVSLLLTSGYSYKALTNDISVVNECLVAPCAVEYSKYKYGYGTIVFKAGISLWK